MSDIDWTIKAATAAILDNLWSRMRVNSGMPTEHLKNLSDLRWAEGVVTYNRGRRLPFDCGFPVETYKPSVEEDEKRCRKCGTLPPEEEEEHA